MLSFFPRDVLDEIWKSIESVSEDFFLPTLVQGVVSLVICDKFDPDI